MTRRLKFTIYHGFAASLALHSALGLPFVAYGLASPPDEPPLIVIELQGVVADSQAEPKAVREMQAEEKPAPASEVAAAEGAVTEAAASETQTMELAADESGTQPPPEPVPAPSPPEAEASAPTAGSNESPSVEDQQKAQTIKADREAIDPLKEYVKLLTKKVQANLVYPDEGRRSALQGTATVSFAILGQGQIRPESLKIVASSGQPRLDSSALRTIRASVPFAPPPKEMIVVIAVAYGRKP